MDKNTPPFQPGDNVIRIGEDLFYTGVYRGHYYVIERVFWCCSHYGWKVYLVGIGLSYGTSSVNCDSCNRALGVPAFIASKFRKIDDLSDHTTESLLEELSEPVLADPLKTHHHV